MKITKEELNLIIELLTNYRDDIRDATPEDELYWDLLQIAETLLNKLKTPEN